jgi:hypothetical protein
VIPYQIVRSTETENIMGVSGDEAWREWEVITFRCFLEWGGDFETREVIVA